MIIRSAVPMIESLMAVIGRRLYLQLCSSSHICQEKLLHISGKPMTPSNATIKEIADRIAVLSAPLPI